MAIQTANVGLAASTVTYTSVNANAVTFMSLCNYSGGTVTVDIHVVPVGGTADTSNILIQEIDIIAGDTYILYHGNEKIVLGDLDFIEVVPTVSGTDVLAVITSYMGV